MKGARGLDRRALAVLRELFVWREALAARLDRAVFRVMGNDVLLALAERQPRSPDVLSGVKGLNREVLAKHGLAIVAAVERGLAVPDAQLPRFDRHPRRRPDPAYEARLERLREARATVAQRIELPPGLLCPATTLEAIARGYPSSTEELARIGGVRRWQAEAFGPDLLAALAPR
jgi:ribonuclease D